MGTEHRMQNTENTHQTANKLRSWTRKWTRLTVEICELTPFDKIRKKIDL